MVSTTRTDFAEIGESDALSAGLSEEERGALERALDFARDAYGEKLLGTGEPAYEHALGLARAPEEERRLAARETLDIYAPLANRLGVWQLKWELEDLSFRYLEPQLYKRIAGMLDERREEREGFIAQAIEELGEELARAGI